jgi:hypothetical protein
LMVLVVIALSQDNFFNYPPKTFHHCGIAGGHNVEMSPL